MRCRSTKRLASLRRARRTISSAVMINGLPNNIQAITFIVRSFLWTLLMRLKDALQPTQRIDRGLLSIRPQVFWPRPRQRHASVRVRHSQKVGPGPGQGDSRAREVRCALRRRANASGHRSWRSGGRKRRGRICWRGGVSGFLLQSSEGIARLGDVPAGGKLADEVGQAVDSQTAGNLPPRHLLKIIPRLFGVTAARKFLQVNVV